MAGLDRDQEAYSAGQEWDGPLFSGLACPTSGYLIWNEVPTGRSANNLNSGSFSSMLFVSLFFYLDSETYLTFYSLTK